jgi:hypothetical protein
VYLSNHKRKAAFLLDLSITCTDESASLKSSQTSIVIWDKPSGLETPKSATMKAAVASAPADLGEYET